MPFTTYELIQLAEKNLINAIDRCENVEYAQGLIKTLFGKVITRMAARREELKLKDASLDQRLSAVRGWLFKEWEIMEREIQTPRYKGLAKPKLRHRIGGMFTIGVTANWRTGDMYYIANFPWLNNTGYKRHPIEDASIYLENDYCGKDKQKACDRMARRLLGFAINHEVTDNQLYRIITGQMDRYAIGEANAYVFFYDSYKEYESEKEYIEKGGEL